METYFALFHLWPLLLSYDLTLTFLCRLCIACIQINAQWIIVKTNWKSFKVKSTLKKCTQEVPISRYFYKYYRVTVRFINNIFYFSFLDLTIKLLLDKGIGLLRSKGNEFFERSTNACPLFSIDFQGLCLFRRGWTILYMYIFFSKVDSSTSAQFSLSAPAFYIFTVINLIFLFLSLFKFNHDRWHR